jgi:peptidoglycan/LPS O-acetylase OafA/YrhL
MRLAFVDNIRWTMILLVLSMHASDTYSPFGSWYYTDRGDMGFGTILAFGIYQTFLQAFFMALLFFIAGYFSAPAFDRKGLGRFGRDRLLRLGVPTLLYMLVIGRRHFDRQGASAKFLSDNAFAVYLFHPPVIIALALLLHQLVAPALLKAALLTVCAAIATFALSALVFRRLLVLNRIL